MRRDRRHRKDIPVHGRTEVRGAITNHDQRIATAGTSFTDTLTQPRRSTSRSEGCNHAL